MHACTEPFFICGVCKYELTRTKSILINTQIDSSEGSSGGSSGDSSGGAVCLSHENDELSSLVGAIEASTAVLPWDYMFPWQYWPLGERVKTPRMKLGIKKFIYLG